MYPAAQGGASEASFSAGKYPDFLPHDRMNEIGTTKSGEYASARPYPHVVIDRFFDDWILDKVLNEFPSAQDKGWELHDIPEEIKLQSKHERNIPRFTRQFLYALNSATFLKFLETLTGIPKLIGDPQFEGGGLHQIPPGGKLAIHVDFNKHSYFNLHRRLNMLVYLNKNWEQEYGGHFELWNQDMTHPVKKVAPQFNRIVIFSTIPNSFHGHPDPLKCPAGMSRKSLALYYYTINSSTEEQGTRHTTLFYKRPGERFKVNARQLVRDLTPPLLWRIIGRGRGV